MRDKPELMKRRKDKANPHSNNKNKKVFIIGLVVAAIVISGILAIVLTSIVTHNVNNNNDQAAKALLIKEISNPTYPLAPALGSSKAKATCKDPKYQEIFRVLRFSEPFKHCRTK